MIRKNNQRQGINQVLRGGDWINNERHRRSANRDRLNPPNQYTNLGFRVVVEIKKIPKSSNSSL
jgi:formylglycine-generating enzyme required for sulfatase activity